MRRNSLKLLIILGLFIFPWIVWGQAKVGTSTFQFLKVSPSARAMGMGEAFIGLANDASAAYYNPAALLTLRSPTGMITHVAYPSGVQFNYIGGVYPLPAVYGAIGGYIAGLTTDDMIETTPTMPYGTGRTFNVSEFTASVSWSQRLTDKFTVGITGRYIRSNLADVSANGWSADVGTYYETGWKNIRIAMVIQNFGPDVKYLQTEHTLPITFKFGGAAEVFKQGDHSVTAAVEGWHPNDNIELIAIGAEYSFRDFVQFRLGKKINGIRRDKYEEYVVNSKGKDPFVEYPLFDENGNLTFDGTSVGFGVSLPIGLSVDYALSNIGYFGELHRISLSYTLK
ncbi:MAG: PorV/PorQ family protein [bacterium]|nr:PorV/PorQ family protein [bacterium]